MAEIATRCQELLRQVGLADKAQGFSWLEKAYQERSWYLTWLKVEPRFDSLHGDPRFQDLMRRVGLLP